MQKRGMLTYKALIELFISIMLVVAFIHVGKAIGTGEFYHKAAIAKDLALVVEQLQAMPGDVTFYYPQDTHRYTIKTSGNTITVASSFLIKDLTSQSTNVIGPPLPETTIEKPQRLLIKKTNNHIYFSTENVQQKG
jgi:hypothetical protein